MDDDATHLPEEEARAMVAWRARTHAAGSGAAAASDTGCRAAHEARRAVGLSGRRASDTETAFQTAALSAGALMARARGSAATTRGTTRRRRADERARRGEREADRWDPAADNSRIKNNTEQK
jgi:hypothetical protein